MYRVLNDNNVYVNITDNDIENSIKTDIPLKRDIIMAMGKTHKTKYLKYLYPYLNHEEDIKLIAKILNAYVEKSISWIIKLPKNEYIEAIILALQSIWYASDETEILQNIEDSLSEQLCIIFQRISEMRIDSYAIEMIADITTGMRKEYAVKILDMIKGKMRGRC